MTGISSVTVNNMVDDTGDGISGTPYNKTFMQSVINDLISTALPLDGSVAMTGALQELFIGLIRKLNPNGTAHIYEYAGGLLATTTSPTGAGFQQAWTYNVPLAATTVPPTVNNWGGRDITDFCVLVQFLDTGVFEIWFDPSAAAGVVPTWTKVYSFNASTGIITSPSVTNLSSYKRTIKEDCWEQAAYVAPPEWTIQSGASTQSIVSLNSIYHTKSLNGAGLMGWVLNRTFIPNSGRTARFRAMLATPGTAAAALLGLFLALDGNNYITLAFYNGNIIMAVYSAGIGSSSTIIAYSINTDYVFQLDVTSTSVNGYIYSTTGALLGSATITTNIPAASALTPRIGNLAGGDANGIMIAESQFTTDALR